MKSSSQHIIDVQAGTCWVEWKLAAAAPAFFQNTHTQVQLSFVLFCLGSDPATFMKNCYTNSGLENGSHKTTISKSFCLCNYLYICLVLDLPLPIMDEFEYGLWPVFAYHDRSCIHPLHLHVLLHLPTWLVINSSPTN